MSPKLVRPRKFFGVLFAWKLDTSFFAVLVELAVGIEIMILLRVRIMIHYEYASFLIVENIIQSDHQFEGNIIFAST